jgi:hypothetical protein
MTRCGDRAFGGARRRARTARAVTALALAAGSGVASAADDPTGISERIFEIQPYVGAFLPDENMPYENSALLGVRGSLNNSSWWAVEAHLALAPGQRRSAGEGFLQSFRAYPGLDANGDTLGWVVTSMDVVESTTVVDTNLLMAGGAATVHLMNGKIRPFVTIGGGYIDDLASDSGTRPGTYSNGYAEIGGGLKVFRRSGWALRLDVSDLVMEKKNLARPYGNAALIAAQHDIVTGGGKDGVAGQEPYDPSEYRGKRWLHNFGISLSVSVPFGWVWKDGDGDNIADRFDRCLTTAPGTVVDAGGCGIDTDEDGVFDGLDQCGATPRGAAVDLAGCPTDTDGDGVPDGLDLMNDTPPGALVDPQGRHSDKDGDGIFDGLDKCDDTPPGANIDEHGCSRNVLEDQLLRGETIVMAGVAFRPGTDEIEPLSYRSVNRIGQVLEYWTGHDERPLRVEIGVYEQNLDLGRRRANRFRAYLLESFAGMEESNLVAVGYPSAGREANRPVEIRSLGPAATPQADAPAGTLLPAEEPQAPEPGID